MIISSVRKAAKQKDKSRDNNVRKSPLRQPAVRSNYSHR